VCFTENYYFKTIKYNFINKSVYKDLKTLPKIKKIALNFSLKTVDTKKLFSGLLFFEVTVNQKGVFTAAKNSVISVKIRKGNPVGCRVTLKKQNLLKTFYTIIFNILLKQKSVNSKVNINKKVKKNFFSFTVFNPIKILRLEKHYYYFNNLSALNITILTNTKSCTETKFFLQSFKFL